jgi:4-amino-4-deoxy-L-arabinose transferase-like glycosyltransferase
LEHRGSEERSGPAIKRARSHSCLIVLVIAAAVFFGTILSPPSLMDDVDGVHGAIGRTMLRTGDWVTVRLDGVAYLEKAPFLYWMIATSYALFGVHDWAARLPIALSGVLLCWVTFWIGAWAFSRRAGVYAGTALATCAGLFLFTRILLPEVVLTLAVSLAIWALLRALEDEEPRPGRWAVVFWIAMAAAVLLKGLLGVLLPVGAGIFYLAFSGQLFAVRTWKRLRPITGLALFLVIAAPWHVLATLRNPPYFDFTLSAEPFRYRGFLWFYFINEHVLRFLNLRHPRDYNTVPRLWFWLLHLVWLFPWSVYFPAAARLSYRPVDRAGRMRLMALCWAGFLLLFFSFSTTQEYYTVPIYPAFALLIGSALDEQAGSAWVRWGTIVASAIAALLAVVGGMILAKVWSLPTPGDISAALTQNPDAYTLSLGHLSDLTLNSFAYLRLPLLLAVVALATGAIGCWTLPAKRKWAALVVMMILFFQAARLALVVFDPYLSSRPLAAALVKSPPGKLIIDGAYYPFSSVFFYADRQALLWNGRFNNLEYGSLAPDSPPVFIDDAETKKLWSSPARWYILASEDDFARLTQVLGAPQLHAILKSGGKALYTNQPVE